MTRAEAQVVLVHGAWHRAACWDKVVAGLGERGIAAIAVELPFEGLAADAAAARAAITSARDDAIVVGHSYGGAVISAGASGLRNVRHLVYLCAFMLGEDETVGDLTTEFPLPLFHHLQVTDGGTIIDPVAAVDLFYGDCTPADVATAVAQLRPLAASPFDTSTRPAWRDVPSTYVVCTADQAVVPALQRRMARHASAVVEWPTSHSPFLSRPELVVELVARVARR